MSGVLFSVTVDRSGDGLRFGAQPLFDSQRAVSSGHPPSGTNSYNYAVSSDGSAF